MSWQILSRHFPLAPKKSASLNVSGYIMCGCQHKSEGGGWCVGGGMWHIRQLEACISLFLVISGRRTSKQAQDVMKKISLFTPSTEQFRIHLDSMILSSWQNVHHPQLQIFTPLIHTLLGALTTDEKSTRVFICLAFFSQLATFILAGSIQRVYQSSVYMWQWLPRAANESSSDAVTR